jgi:hypothetical protein
MGWKLMYLCNTKGFDTHGGVMGLHVLDWSYPVTKDDNKDNDNNNNVNMNILSLHAKRREIVPPVIHPDPNALPQSKVDGMAFPGLFVNQLPFDDSCHVHTVSDNGKFLFLATHWGCHLTIVCIDLGIGDVVPIRFDMRGGDLASTTKVTEEEEEGKTNATTTGPI